MLARGEHNEGGSHLSLSVLLWVLLPHLQCPGCSAAGTLTAGGAQLSPCNRSQVSTVSFSWGHDPGFTPQLDWTGHDGSVSGSSSSQLPTNEYKHLIGSPLARANVKPFIYFDSDQVRSRFVTSTVWWEADLLPLCMLPILCVWLHFLFTHYFMKGKGERMWDKSRGQNYCRMCWYWCTCSRVHSQHSRYSHRHWTELCFVVQSKTVWVAASQKPCALCYKLLFAHQIAWRMASGELPMDYEHCILWEKQPGTTSALPGVFRGIIAANSLWQVTGGACHLSLCSGCWMLLFLPQLGASDFQL